MSGDGLHIWTNEVLIARWLDERCSVHAEAAGSVERVGVLRGDFKRWWASVENRDPPPIGVFMAVLFRQHRLVQVGDGTGSHLRLCPIALRHPATGGVSKVSSLQSGNRRLGRKQECANFGNLFSRASDRMLRRQVTRALRGGMSVRETERSLCRLLTRTHARLIIAAAKADAARDHHPANSGV